MYEVWEVTDGREAGELIVTTTLAYAEMTAKLRSRLRKVGNTKYPTVEELERFRKLLARPDTGRRAISCGDQHLVSSH